MKDDICLSIIIPVYNAEPYLSKCMDALLSTDNIDDAEIIIVDDGSTDGSSDTAFEYASRCPFIFVFHKENGGPSDARNFGLSNAKGKYIFFCDSDDEVIPERFAEIIKLTKSVDTDVILWDSMLIDKDGSTLEREDKNDYIHFCLKGGKTELTGREYLEAQFSPKSIFPATVWTGAFRRDFLISNELLFEKDLIHEDELWITKVFLCASSIRYVSEVIYQYRIRQGSITNPETEDRTKHIESLLIIYPKLFALCEEKLSGDPLLKKIEGALTQRYLYMIYKYNFNRFGYYKSIDRKKLWKTSTRLKDKIKIILLPFKR